MIIYPPSRFAEAVHEKVESSCGAAASFSWATSGTRRARILGRPFFGSFFVRTKKEHTNQFENKPQRKL
jgi:hypothetical protein